MVFDELTDLSFEEVIKLAKFHNLTFRYSDDLYLMKYNRNSECDLKNGFVENCRGAIFDRNTNKCVNYAFSKGMDYDEFKKTYNICDIIIEESIDGTMLNIYYHNDKWNFSTKGMIDSNKSFWFSKKSFYKMFLECLKFDLDSLNKNYCYSFVITHPENRIVTRYDNGDLYLVRIRDMATLEIVENIPKINVRIPKEFKFTSYEELEKNLKKLDYEKEGYMLFSKNKKDRVKIKGPKYLKAFELKGNQANKTFHLLDIIINKQEYEYLQYFYEDKYEMDRISLKISNLVENLFNIYFNMRVRKIKVDVPFKFKPLIFELHGIYLREKAKIGKYKTTRKSIHKYIYQMDIPRVYFVLFKKFNKDSDSMEQYEPT